MKRVAIFDFDDTLVQGDSFVPFLRNVAGPLRTYAALAEGLATFVLNRLYGAQKESLRTHVKSVMMTRLLKGRSRASVRAAALRTLAWRRFIPSGIAALRDHHAQGALIVVASGGLDLYLPELLQDVPFDALICTDVGVTHGVIDGTMCKGNCVRQRKAERVAEWLEMHGPFDESFGYGNYPHDVPMLSLVKHRIIVS